MVIMNSCCCWRSVRQGSYACGVYTLLYFTVTAATMSRLLHEDLLYLRSNGTISPHSILDPDTTSESSIIFTVLLLIISSIGILTSLLLLLGLYWDKRIFLIPWTLTMIPLIILDLVHCVYIFIEHTLKFDPLNAILFTLDFFLFVLHTYVLLCVISQYQELKAGRGRATDDINRMPSIHYNNQPTATSFLSTRRAVTYNETHATPTQSPTGTGPHTSLGTEEPSPHIVNRGPRKSVKFPDQDSPTNNGRTLLEPWHIDIPKVESKDMENDPLIQSNINSPNLIISNL